MVNHPERRVVIPASAEGLMETFRSQLSISASAWESEKAGNGDVTIADIYLVI